MRRILLPTLVAGLAAAFTAHANEGMWTLDNLPVEKMKKEIGFAPDAAWREHVMRGAARIAGGCSASFVSPDGLVLSNHHCVAHCLGHISSEQHDYFAQGFVARSREEEAVCPAMEINRLEAITDVTRPMQEATAGKQGIAFQQAQDAARARLTSACVGDEGKRVRCDVVDLYHGGQYKLYRYHRFQDVRLVFAPEQAIAFFGGDPDNFNFPRYDLDMSMVRVYEDGKPAHIADFFPLSPTGPAAGDATFVVGNPGSTQRQLTASQLAMLRDLRLPEYLFRAYEYRGLLARWRTESPENSRVANDTLFSVENSIKALRGEYEALIDPVRMHAFEQAEQSLRRFAAQAPGLPAGTAGAWDEIARANATFLGFRPLYRQIEDGLAFNSELFPLARDLVRGTAERAKPNGERLPEFQDSALPQLEAQLLSPAPVHPEFEKIKLAFSLEKMREVLGPDAPLVHSLLGQDSPAQVAARLVDGSRLADPAVRKALWEGGKAAVDASQDPFVVLARLIDEQARALRHRYENEVKAPSQRAAERIARARFAMNGTGDYPDATFTMRLSYGTVRGWREGESEVKPFTDMAGAFTRATGSAPFALPASWLAAKDRIDGAKPLNLVTDNDIIGGNSGSPMLNRKGELVGLVFDGNIHSLGGAFWFDPDTNRTVAVDSAAILEALDKIYDARGLLDELRRAH